MPGASSTSRWQEDSVPLSRVRSMCAGAGMSLWMSYSARADPEPLAVPQLVDPDAFLCRQVGISFHIERDTFSSVVDLNNSNHRAGVALLFRTQGVGTCRHTDIKPVTGMGMAGERECRGNGTYRHAASGADKRSGWCAGWGVSCRTQHAGKPPAQVLQESVDWDAPARLRVVRADSRPPSVNFVDSSRQREPKWVTSPNW